MCSALVTAMPMDIQLARILPLMRDSVDRLVVIVEDQLTQVAEAFNVGRPFDELLPRSVHSKGGV